MIESIRSLRDFGTRSVVTHAIMGLSFLAAIASAFLLTGQLRTVSFVAFLNFTAGMWICQSIHAVGNSFTDDDYDGITGML